MKETARHVSAFTGWFGQHLNLNCIEILVSGLDSGFIQNLKTIFSLSIAIWTLNVTR